MVLSGIGICDFCLKIFQQWRPQTETVFLLSALRQLPAIFVYPATNIGIIVFTTLGATLLWKEKLNKMGHWALVTGIVAIVLLGI
jgi:multidrug transporter EmrE-like cation transporter